ncbi:type IV secretory system conjugative DNA transfer family protein [Lentibacillus songyuanensis]|uniref:type IV secretory system conjugative DNA transfer family protein n=1 Tax=Lentibacillus songyuanensis TaxID=3136161 RepID=UPI0031BADF3F
MPIPIKWQGDDCFTHMLVVGATRSGKTATILKPMIYQLLLMKKRGIPLGLSVVEPKGDVAQMVNDMCVEMDISVTHVDPFKSNTAKFNPMEGEINAVAEATVVVLKGLFGKQDAFFATVQELSARNVTKLLKELYDDKLDIIDVMNTLRDPDVLKKRVAELRARDGQTDLVHFFESELMGSMADKYRQFVIGLRAQLENIVSNQALRHIMTGKGDIDIDKHFAEGGVLAVNTALGLLRKSGDAFGQFIIMHLQNGTFRRPGTERTRVPHFLIVDEYSRYINPDVEIFLSLAAEYRVAGVFATQSLGQLEIESGNLNAKAMKQAILTSCRNKLVFGGLSSEDAKEFAEEFGKDKVIMRQSTYKNRILIPRFFPDNYRDTEQEEYRFDFTDIMDGLPRFHFIHKLLQDGKPQPPGIAMGSFVPRNWKELREWEESKKEPVFSKLKDQLIRNIKDKNTVPLRTNEKVLQQDKKEENDAPDPDLTHLGLNSKMTLERSDMVEGDGHYISDDELKELDELNYEPAELKVGFQPERSNVKVKTKTFSFQSDLPKDQDNDFW